ncbi:HK97 gp10 family phage protein [Oceanobacillus luteolus]|uniref:HK97-gp10 family putative phage morphogenesis protein n=1 Tax=Oceanobacillus luteolus TaxID=1274358 RepID=UPI0020414419|nr:HK97-gp10 family putative phage morphogenesis protein [Oceanobacillus luteolus]MCM3739234.1 HK97 gp10 family phage protein [Oceanobacillus luteolus]
MVNFKSNKREVKQRMERANRNMLDAVGKAAVAHVKLVTPVDIGTLQGSIEHKNDDKSVYVGSTLTSEDYPVYVEKGTSKMAAQPYIEPGIKLNAGNLRTVAERNYKP